MYPLALTKNFILRGGGTGGIPLTLGLIWVVSSRESATERALDTSKTESDDELEQKGFEKRQTDRQTDRRTGGRTYGDTTRTGRRIRGGRAPGDSQ